MYLCSWHHCDHSRAADRSDSIARLFKSGIFLLTAVTSPHALRLVGYADGGSGNDFNAYTTVVSGATNLDIAQGGSNNCFILASMGAAASRGVDIGSRITYSGNGNYNVALFRKAGRSYTPTSVSVQFDGTLKATDPAAHFRAQEGESWTVIMSRALAQLLNVNLSTTTGGYTGDVLGAILGRAPSTTTWVDKAFSPLVQDPPP